MEGSYLSEKSSYTIAVTRLDCEMVTFKKGEIESNDVRPVKEEELAKDKRDRLGIGQRGAKGWRMKDVAVKHYCCV